MSLKDVKTEDMIKELLTRKDVKKYSDGTFLEIEGPITVIALEDYYEEFE